MHLRVDALRRLFDEKNYTVEGVLGRIGQAGQDGLGRNSTVPAATALGKDLDPLAALIRLFLLQESLSLASAGKALDLDLLDSLQLVHTRGGSVSARVDVRPYESPDDGASGYLVSDLTPGLDHATPQTKPDYVLGASPASLTLTQLTVRDHASKALDLGTGCGVQALHLARHCDEVIATDLNPRALKLARLSAALSEIQLELRRGSLYEPVAGEAFDLIVSNPPYVISPPEGKRLTYREGSHSGDSLTEAVVRQAADHLRPGGTAQFLSNWAITANQSWQDRLRGWIEKTGLDCWAIERERMDPFEYIELWLTDAGLAGTAGWRPAYERWLSYFDQLGIEAIGMGWLHLSAAGRDQPSWRFEAWPHSVEQPVGAVFAKNRSAIDAADLPLGELLQARLQLTDVQQETIGEPGAADPQHIILRQRRGLLRAIRVGTVEAAVLGTMDGTLTLAQVIPAAAEVLGVDQTQLAAQVTPVVRDALRDQFLQLC